MIQPITINHYDTVTQQHPSAKGKTNGSLVWQVSSEESYTT